MVILLTTYPSTHIFKVLSFFGTKKCKSYPSSLSFVDYLSINTQGLMQLASLKDANLLGVNIFFVLKGCVGLDQSIGSGLP